MSDYGKKGGTSATAGKVSVKYEATAPDGTVLTKRSFKAGDEVAVMNIYKHENVWYANCVYNRSNQPGWFTREGAVLVDARRVA